MWKNYVILNEEVCTYCRKRPGLKFQARTQVPSILTAEKSHWRMWKCRDGRGHWWIRLSTKNYKAVLKTRGYQILRHFTGIWTCLNKIYITYQKIQTLPKSWLRTYIWLLRSSLGFFTDVTNVSHTTLPNIELCYIFIS